MSFLVQEAGIEERLGGEGVMCQTAMVAERGEVESASPQDYYLIISGAGGK